MAVETHRSVVPDSDPEGEVLWIILDAKTGVFKYRPSGGVEKLVIPAVKGVLASITLEWDADGDPEHRVKPHWEIVIHLEETKAGSNELGKSEIVFGASVPATQVLERLSEIVPGQVISMRAKPGPSTTFIDLAVLGDRGWEDIRKRIAQGEDSAEKYAWMLGHAHELPAYEGPAIIHTPEGPSTRTVAREPVSVAPAIATAEAPPETEGLTLRERATGKRIGTEAYGYRPPRQAPKDWMSQPVDPTQWAKLRAIVDGKGLGGADMDRHLHKAVMEAYSYELHETRHSVATLIEFLLSAGPDSISAAKKRADMYAEYDPFEDGLAV